LTASGCSGTVTWSDGSTGNTLTVSQAGSYSATCTQNACTSSPSPITVSSCSTEPSWLAARYTYTSTANGNLLTLQVAGNSAQSKFERVDGINFSTTNPDNISIQSNQYYNPATLTAAPDAYNQQWQFYVNAQIQFPLRLTFKRNSDGALVVYTVNPTLGDTQKPLNPSTCSPPTPPTVVASNDGQLCNNLPVTLTASGCTGNVTWNNGLTGSQITVGAGNGATNISYNRVLFVGNSITLYPATIANFYVDASHPARGMAATQPSYDYVRRMTAHLQGLNSSVDVRTLQTFNVSGALDASTGPYLESKLTATNPNEFYSEIATRFNAVVNYAPDILYFSLGENVDDGAIPAIGQAEFQTRIKAWIDKMVPAGASTKVILRTSVWDKPNYDIAVKAIATERSYPIANFEGMFAGRNTNGYYALGVYSEQGINIHPDDDGMLHMANLLWNVTPKTTSTQTGTGAGTYWAVCSLGSCTSGNSNQVAVTNCSTPAFSWCTEAETSNGNGNRSEQTDSQASAGKFVGGFGGTGEFMEYTIANVPTATSYTLHLWYTSGETPQIGIVLNGNASNPLLVTATTTGRWVGPFVEKTVSIPLNTGVNTLRIQGSGNGNFGLDKLCVDGGTTQSPATPSWLTARYTYVYDASRGKYLLTVQGAYSSTGPHDVQLRFSRADTPSYSSTNPDNIPINFGGTNYYDAGDLNPAQDGYAHQWQVYVDSPSPPLTLRFVRSSDGVVYEYAFTPAGGTEWKPLTGGTGVTGSLQPATKARIYTRSDCCEERYLNCIVQGSNVLNNELNATTWIELGRITQQPARGTWVDIPLATNSFRYVRFVASAVSGGELVELQFYNNNTKLTGTPFGSPSVYDVSNPTAYTYTNAFDDKLDYFWHGSAGGPENYAGLDLAAVPQTPTTPSWLTARYTYVYDASRSKYLLTVQGSYSSAGPHDVQLRFSRGDNSSYTTTNPDNIPIAFGGSNYYDAGNLSPAQDGYAHQWQVYVDSPSPPLTLRFVRSSDSQVYEYSFTPTGGTDWKPLTGGTGTTPQEPSNPPAAQLKGGFAEGSLAELLAFAPFIPDQNQTWLANTEQTINNEFVIAGIHNSVGGSLTKVIDKRRNENMINTYDRGYPNDPGQWDTGRSSDFSQYGTPGKGYTEDGFTTDIGDDTGYNGVAGGSRSLARSPIVQYQRKTVTGYGEVLYVKTRPYQWSLPSTFTNFYRHAYYWLEGRNLRYFYIVENFRNDNQMYYQGRQQEGPFIYLTGTHYHYKVETGTDGNPISIENLNYGNGVASTADYLTTKNYISAHNDAGWGLTLFTPYCSNFCGKQFLSIGGGVGSNESSYINCNLIIDMDSPRTTAYTGYMHVGNLEEFKAWRASQPVELLPFATSFAGGKFNGWSSIDGRMKTENGSVIFYIGDTKPFNPFGDNDSFRGRAKLNSPFGNWKASDLNTIFINATVTGVTQLNIGWIKAGQGEADTPPQNKTIYITPSSLPQTIRIDMGGTNGWDGTISRISIGTTQEIRGSLNGTEVFKPHWINTIDQQP
jgi:hypothetical protein